MFMRILILLLANNFAHAEMIFKHDKEGFVDRSWYEAENQIIERKLSAQAPSEKIYELRQRFKVIDSNTLEYIPYSSSKDTLMYIKEVCEKREMLPAKEPIPGISYRRISMKTPFGMSCTAND